MAIPKTEGRDEFLVFLEQTFQDAEEAGKTLPRNYTDRAEALMPGVDRALLREAKRRRRVYWPAIPAFRKVLGLPPVELPSIAYASK